jgi:teichuronic acid biosynthesis glycosyltransferase TuaC
MKRIKCITVITPNYPRPKFPESGAFIEKLVYQWNNIGLTVDVVAPLSLPGIVRTLIRKPRDITIAGHKIVRPVYLSTSNQKIARIDFKLFSSSQFLKAAARGIKQLPSGDAFYGQFLFNSGHAALKAGQLYNLPSFVDMGESRFMENLDTEEKAVASSIIPQLTGIVCVSERLCHEVISLGASPNSVLLMPNMPDMHLFKPQDKQDCRRKLNLPLNVFLVVFVGHYIERKGPLRVLQAIEKLSDNKTYGLFLGRGPQVPAGQKVLHAAPVPNNELPIWLNAADLFVLPTLAEGHCNAINEAMACGLPIVSSNISDIQTQIPQGGGVLVDPYDIKALSDAIYMLQNDSERMAAIIQINQKFLADKSLDKRARAIYEWMNSFA